MSNTPQDDFADRCLAALKGIVSYSPDVNETEVRKVLAGSWQAFEAMRQQRSPHNHMPPYSAEVEDYLKVIEYPIDAQHFIDFYQTRGWKISKGVPMKDWKSALRNWKREGWGQRLDRAKPEPVLRQHASLGALQIQLERVRQEIANIVRPGGSAHPRLASSISPEEMKRYNDLVTQRDGLVKRIEGFTS